MTNRITFCFVLFCLLFIATVNAQSYTQPERLFGKGQLDLSVGIGLTPSFLLEGGTMIVPPLSLSADYMVNKKLSLGMYGGFSRTDGQKKMYPIADKGHVVYKEGQWRNTYSEFGLRAAIHYNELEKWDFYGGMQLGYSISKIDALLPDLEEIENHLGIVPVRTTFLPGAFVGAKYAISNRISAFSEIGCGVSLVKAGFSVRLK